MLIKKPSDIKSSEITSESAYLSRRSLVKAMAAAGVVGVSMKSNAGIFSRLFSSKEEFSLKPLSALPFEKNTQFDTDES